METTTEARGGIYCTHHKTYSTGTGAVRRGCIMLSDGRHGTLQGTRDINGTGWHWSLSGFGVASSDNYGWASVTSPTENGPSEDQIMTALVTSEAYRHTALRGDSQFSTEDARKACAEYEASLNEHAEIEPKSHETLHPGSTTYRVISGGGLHVFEVGSDRCLTCLPLCKRPNVPVRREMTVAAPTPHFAVDLARLRWFGPSQGYRVSEGMATRLGEKMACVRRAALERVAADRKDAERLANLKRRWDGVTAPEGSDMVLAKKAGATYADRKLRAEGRWPADDDTTGSLRWYEIAVSAARMAYETGAYERIATMG